MSRGAMSGKRNARRGEGFEMMTRATKTLGALAVVAWTAAAGSALAQGSSALVDGTVRDASGGGRAGATVTLASDDTGLKRTSVTPTSGAQLLSMIPPA